MLENIEVLCHSCIKFQLEKTIYTDPFNLSKNYNDADIILITHAHYDHFSEEDIRKVKKENTIICITEDLYERAIELGFNKENIVKVQPNNTYQILGIEENAWVGYLLNLNNCIYYIAGDTDITEENTKVNCDVAFVPVGGTYTMDCYEASKLVNIIKPKIAVPIHYGSIVGKQKDVETFIENLDKEIQGKIMMQ